MDSAVFVVGWITAMAQRAGGGSVRRFLNAVVGRSSPHLTQREG